MKINNYMPFVVNKRTPENYYRTRVYIKTRPHCGSRVPCLTPIHNGGVHKRHYLANKHNGGVHKRHYLANIHNGGVHKEPYVAYVHSGGVHKTTFRHCVHSGGVNILCHFYNNCDIQKMEVTVKYLINTSGVRDGLFGDTLATSPPSVDNNIDLDDN